MKQRHLRVGALHGHFENETVCEKDLHDGGFVAAYKAETSTLKKHKNERTSRSKPARRLSTRVRRLYAFPAVEIHRMTEQAESGAGL